MKRITAILSILCMLASMGICSYASQDVYTKTPGTVTIEGGNAALAGEDILMIVLDKSSGNEVSWSDVRAGSDFSDVTYYDTAKSNSLGEYTFSFEPGKSGIYKCNITGDGQPEGFDLYYINTNHLAQANSDLKADNADIKAELLEHRFDFGIFTNDYIKADIDNVTAFVAEAVTQDNTRTDYTAVVKHSFLAELLNSGKLSNVQNNLSILALEEMEINDYYNKQYDSVIKEKLVQKASFERASDVEKAVMEVLTGLTIQYNDGTDDIKGIIKKCSAVSGVNKSKVTSSLCQAIAGSGDYYDFATLKSFIDNYKEPGNSGGGGAGGGGGGGGAVKPSNPAENINVSDMTITTQPDNEKDIEATDVKVIFKDVPNGHWAKAMIEELYNEGVVSGKGDGVFAPEENVTREEFVKLLVTSMNLNTIGDKLRFNDVPEDAWYYNYVYTAFNSGIVNGTSETTFGSGEYITRQDLAVMAYNVIKACDLKTSGKSDSSFNDFDQIADYAKAAVSALKADEILSGDGGSFRPNDKTTRAEAVKIIYMLKSLK